MTEQHNDFAYDASLEEIKRGYIETETEYICVCCGYTAEKGVIYPHNEVLYESFRYIQIHIQEEHGSVFQFLISQDKKVSGLSDIQRRLLAEFYEGKKDAEIQKGLGIGSTSTIRNHRFVLREKERQAKVLLAVMELLHSRDHNTPVMPVASPNNRAGQATNKETDLTAEQEKVLTKYFPFGTDGPLETFAVQEKHRLIIMKEIAKRFDTNKVYSESEVNGILDQIYEDYVLLRRSMVDYGILSREEDGSSYWLTPKEGESRKMANRREELKQLAKEIKTEAGVYQIRNKENGKRYVASTPNLKSLNGQQFMLNMGSHRNRRLQEEWKEYGEEAFAIEVVEKLKIPESNIFFDVKDALKKLEASWLEKLQPYGENGYNEA
ncbi:hypothetical protein J45TS6_28210 [Paenibacillus sp. J45TS6]|uniref:DUF2087 domain-containing protein n=1 Tax=Paenibacillus sp. J45TS6 TaxID=2807196 RepID=UPI001B15374B|nr:DUF2087 domain-containing protein [Paenibacillus sp. J45TS6]GIP44362.1 hypothetical protein J45TS6_28210 [Paenibacillus sp. J45TS6]